MEKSIKLEQQEFLRLCICERCPTYSDCSKKGFTRERAFCSEKIGKSKCISQQRGCICGACPVKQKMEFKNFYFCMLGSEEQQNRKKK